MYQALTLHPHTLRLMRTLALLILVALLSSTGALAQSASCDNAAATVAEAERLRAEWKTSQLKEAIEKYREAQICFRSANRKAEEADALKRIGDIYFSLSDYEAARQSYEAALELRKATGDPAAEAGALADFGTVLTFLGQNDRAAPLCRRAVMLSRESGNKRAEAHALGSLGLLQYMGGDLQSALATFNQRLSLAREAGDGEEEAQAQLHLGWVHQETNDIEQALEDYNRSLSLCRSLKHRQGEVKALTGLGLAYTVLGERQKALEYLDEQALPALREMGDRIGEAAAHNNIGYLYKTLGEDRIALKHHLEALEIFKQVNLVIGQAVSAEYVGYCYEVLGNEQEAIRYYEQALAAARLINHPLIEADTLINIGALKLSLGMNQIAYDHFQSALAVHQKAGQVRGQAWALTNLGRYFEVIGEKRKALDYYERALALTRVLRDRYEEAFTLFSMAKVELGLGLLDSARSNIESALKLSELLRDKVSSHKSRATYFGSVHRQFELYVDVLMRQHALRPAGRYEAAAFEASERGRARSLLETLAEARGGIRQGVDASLLERERQLQRQLNAKAERRIKLGEEKASAQELAAIEEEVDALMIKYQQLQGQIRASNPRYATLVQPVPLTLREIQQKVLDADTVLLEYALGEERSFVWTVTPDSIKGFELPSRAIVERAARRMYELLTARNRQVKGETWQQSQGRIRQADNEYAEASAALGRMLLGPIAGELGSKRLVIVADGALQYVPFAALPLPATSESGVVSTESQNDRESNTIARQKADSGFRTTAPVQPLIVEHEVVSLPSASVLAMMRDELRGRQPAPKSVAVLADPVFDINDERIVAAKGSRTRRDAIAGTPESRVESASVVPDPGAAQRALRDFDGLSNDAGIGRLPFSRREAEVIMKSVPTGDAMLALGFRANRATAIGPELSQYRVVHFATHGLLNSEHPELSGVVLSLFDETGKRQDGFLQLHEIYNLNLPADLVVLSACQTALGKEIRGEGLIGLTRGFMYAGAPRVVASLWKVDDAATAKLMGEFYKAMLGQGMRPAAALRAAQIHLWRQNQWHSPYYWAAFTLQGEWK